MHLLGHTRNLFRADPYIIIIDTSDYLESLVVTSFSTSLTLKNK